MPDLATTLIDLARRDGFLTESQAAKLAERLRRGEARLGKFELIQKLGEGGMGEVWKAWQTDLQRWVAVKFVKGERPEDVARFIREAQTAAKLAHPNIVAVHEAGELDGRQYIAMNYVDGEDLGKRRVDLKQALALMRDVAEAVHYAHLQGIVHRDLKPANLMLTKEGRVLVMDFGLAKGMAAPGVSHSGTIVGTPFYMPPEQAGGEPVDARSDVYSLGATLYELATGRPPFEGKDVLEVLRKVVGEDPPPPRVDRDTATIIQKAMEKEPARRYATAHELAEDLRRALAGEPIAARPASWAYRMQKHVRRQPMLWTLAALLALAVAAGSIFGIWQLARAARERGQKVEALELQRHAERQAAAVDRALVLLTQAENLTYDPDVSFESIAPAAGELVQVADANLAAYPREARLWYFKGKGHLLLGEEDAAEAAFSRAIELDAADGRSWYERGQIYMGRFSALLMGETEEDRKAQRDEARHWLRKASENLARAGTLGAQEARAAEVWTLLADDMPEKAVVAASARIARGGRTEAFYLLRAATQEPELALKDLGAALDRRPGLWQAWRDRGALLYTLGRHDEAIRDLDAALRINPRCPWSFLQRGQAHKAKGRHDLAILDYDRALEVKKDLAVAHYNRGNSHYALGRPDLAMLDYDRALEIKKDFAGAHFNRGNVHHAQGRFDEAIADFDRTIELKADHAAAYNARGNAYHAKGQVDRAIQDYDQAVRVDAEFADAYFNRGIAHNAQGRHDRAIADYDRALRIKPEFAEAYANRGDAHRAEGRFDRAIADYDRALELKKDYVQALLNRGYLHQAEGRHDDAIRDFDRAIELNPDYAQAYVNRGISYKAKDQLDRAIQDFDRAVELKKDLPEAYVNRGATYAIKGRYDRAVSDFEQALSTAPSDWAHRAAIEAYLAEARRCLKEQEF